VDDPALAIGGVLAEHALDLHADLRLCRVHHDLRRDLRAFVEFHNREHVGGEHRILLGRRVDHGERDDRALAPELVPGNLSCPAAVRAEGSWREKVPAGRFDRDNRDLVKKDFIWISASQGSLYRSALRSCS
jgi:hypothetical protein